ncbi:MAG: four helix bundle protein [bacterium]|nr:four helix bundle protein [bacterium]MBU1917307.1 four helix bundle protein [bacterium]
MKKYDLEDRCFEFARNVRLFLKEIGVSASNIEDGKQLIRSSGSVGANYIEANESLGKKDFLMHIKISRKEAKESCYWLKLLDIKNEEQLESKRRELIQETTELMNIFGAILRKSE